MDAIIKFLAVLENLAASAILPSATIDVAWKTVSVQHNVQSKKEGNDQESIQ